jgi:hypothetical protein
MLPRVLSSIHIQRFLYLHCIRVYTVYVVGYTILTLAELSLLKIHVPVVQYSVLLFGCWSCLYSSVVDPKLFFSDPDPDPALGIISDPDPACLTKVIRLNKIKL